MKDIVNINFVVEDSYSLQYIGCSTVARTLYNKSSRLNY
jgi:hypothetical protein